MINYTCSQCLYFNSNDSTCRCNAPTTLDMSTPPTKQQAVWPTVNPSSDWCGEFKQQQP
jgi:hypothetical protein